MAMLAHDVLTVRITPARKAARMEKTHSRRNPPSPGRDALARPHPYRSTQSCPVRNVLDYSFSRPPTGNDQAALNLTAGPQHYGMEDIRRFWPFISRAFLVGAAVGRRGCGCTRRLDLQRGLILKFWRLLAGPHEHQVPDLPML
jgi:hypothetical protein